MIKLGQLLADLPDLDNPGLVKAEGCLPGSPNHYKPWPTLQVTTNALDGRALGAAGGLSNSGAAFSFGGDAGKLYRLLDQVYSDVSKAGGYATTGENRWDMGIYRDNMIATNLDDPVQIFTMGTDTVFRDMGTSTPKAKFFAVWRNVPILAYTDDTTDGVINFRVWSGPPGNPEGDWTPNIDTRVGFRDLERADEIMGLVSGDHGMVLTKKSVYRPTWIGGADLWQYDETIVDKGCVASGSIATDEHRTFYLSEDGWYVTNGLEIKSIGHLKFNEFFLKDAKSADYGFMRAQIDPRRTLLLVAYVGQDAVNTHPNRVMAYDWELERATFVDETIEDFIRSIAPGKSLEGVSALFPGGLETVTPSLDDRLWAGGSLVNGAFNEEHKAGTFGGPAARAYFETGEVQLGQLAPEQGKVAGSGGQRTFVAGVRPHVESNLPISVQCRVGARGLESPLEQVVNWTSFKDPDQRIGYTDERSDAWFHRVAMQVPAGEDWGKAQGFDVDAEGSGNA